MSSHDTKNPNGGVSMGHVIEPPDPNSFIIRLRPISFVKRPERTRKPWRCVDGERNSPLPD